MTEQQRKKWLSGLKVNDPVIQKKTTVAMKDVYIEEIAEDGSMLVGDRWYEPDGTSGKGLFTGYEIIPVTPETSAQLQHRQAANYMQGVHWSMYSMGDLQAMIEFIRSLNRDRREAA